MKTQTNNLTYSKTLLVFAIILLLAGGEMWGQNIENNGTIENFGKITLKNANAVLNNGDGTVAGSFDNSAATAEVIFSNTTPSLNNNTGSTFNNGGGTITFGPNSTVPVIKNDAGYADFTTALGTIKYQGAVAAADVIYTGTNAFGTDVTRVMGTVSYERTTGDNQQYIRTYYYQNLSVSGGAAATGSKTIQDGVYVSGIYTAADGNRTYQGTFHYDGVLADGDQTVFGENGGSAGSNRYLNLDLTLGPKITTAQVIADGQITIASDASLTTGAAFTIGAVTSANSSSIEGPVTINTGAFTTSLGTGTVNIVNAVTVNAGGSLVVPDVSATVTFAAGAGTPGTLVLANDETAVLDVNGTGTVEFYSTFTNNFAARTNMTFDETSTVKYIGSAAQEIVSTASTDDNKYGNLITDGAGNKSANGDVYMKGALTVGATAPIIMTLTDDPDAVADNFVLDMAGNKTATFDANIANSYVRGKMRRSGAMVADQSYTFNNALTTLTFEAAKVPTTFQLSVLAGVTPLKGQVDLTTDLKRTVRSSYTTTDDARIKLLRIGYLDNEKDGFTGDENRLRFAEGYATDQDHQKLSRQGATYDREFASDPNYIDLLAGTSTTTSKGIDLVNGYAEDETDPDAIFILASNSDIILTSAAAPLISVTNGRWTNTNTWDEGRLPDANDNVLIKHVVYTGHSSIYGGSDAGVPTEASHYGTDAAANSIEIINATGIFTNPALVIRNDDNTLNYIFKTRTSGAAIDGILPGIYNKGNGTIEGDWNDVLTGPGVGRTINGLWITTAGSDNPTWRRILGTAKVDNQGKVKNYGEIEIGE